MILTHYQKLLDYNLWSNKLSFDAGQSLKGDVSKQYNRIFSHILAAERVWYNRVTNNPKYRMQVWEELETHEIPLFVFRNYEDWKKLLLETAPDKIIQYTDSFGEIHESSFLDIITHLINHGSSHRSQLNRVLRQNKIEPPVIDYIYYVIDGLELTNS